MPVLFCLFFVVVFFVFFGCIVCPFACFLVVLYWSWTFSLLCFYVHIQRWVQRVVICAYVRHVPILP